jgi:hypothetical protein
MGRGKQMLNIPALLSRPTDYEGYSVSEHGAGYVREQVLWDQEVPLDFNTVFALFGSAKLQSKLASNKVITKRGPLGLFLLIM